jgi:hypothetical protein
MAKLQYLVIHCTATPEGRKVTSDEIRKWHLSQPPVGRGWRQVGYTDMIHIDGTVERLVDNNEDGNVDGWEITNGATGINSVSRHVVYVGGVDPTGNRPKDTRTADQKAALRYYVRQFILMNPDIKIAGHNQFASKACPSFDVRAWLRSIGAPEKNIN